MKVARKCDQLGCWLDVRHRRPECAGVCQLASYVDSLPYPIEVVQLRDPAKEKLG